MSLEPADATLFPIQRRDAKDRPAEEIGQLALSEDGRLSVAQAAPAYQTPLERIVQSINALDKLRIKVPPPPAAERGGVYFEEVGRGEPLFEEALQSYLDEKYNLALVLPELSEEGEAAAPATIEPS